MDVREMIAVVQAYINHRTGKTVQINIRGGQDLILLQRAYNIAINYFHSIELL